MPGVAATSPGLRREVRNGPTMGTRWSAIFFAPPDADLAAIGPALQASVDAIDDQMSPWKPNSVLSRLNAAPPGTPVDLPPETFAVVAEALEINALTGGTFDPFVGAAVDAWGFGAGTAAVDPATISRQANGRRAVAFDPVRHRLVRHGDAARLDLCGIAKGFGADRLAETLVDFGCLRHLVAIDGEVRAGAPPPGRTGWAIAIERPDEQARDVAAGLEIAAMAVATSGRYRHWRDVGGRRVSHTIDPLTGAPVDNRLLSVSVLADTCMLADGLATALMVMGTDRALDFSERTGLAALLIEADAGGSQRLVPTRRYGEITGLDFPA